LHDGARRIQALPTRSRPGWTGYSTLYGERVVPFDLRTARRWGALSAALSNDSADLVIAATALEHGLTVVTHNVSDFEHRGHRPRSVQSTA
jgi:PIN domain